MSSMSRIDAQLDANLTDDFMVNAPAKKHWNHQSPSVMRNDLAPNCPGTQI